MHEGPPNQENIERVTKEQVIESLRQNPKDLSLLHRFLDRREAEVRSSHDALTLNVEVAEIYRDAGLRDAARTAFEDAAEQAWQEHEDTLYEQLMNEVDELG